MVESAVFELTCAAMKGERVLHLRRVPWDMRRSVDALRPGQCIYVGLIEHQLYSFSELAPKLLQRAVIDVVTEGAIRLVDGLWFDAAQGESVVRPTQDAHDYVSLA